MKCCSKCGATKALTEFHKNAQSKDGYRPDCAACNRSRRIGLQPFQGARVCKACGVSKEGSHFDPSRAVCRCCRADKARAYRVANPEVRIRQAAADAKRRVENGEHMRAVNKAWREGRTEHLKQATYKWRQDNPERYREITAISKTRNHAAVRLRNAERRAGEVRATPPWANKRAMLAFWDVALLMNIVHGTSHHVDHIVPLKSRLVCGLNCESNLQVLPARENIAKRNLHWPDMP